MEVALSTEIIGAEVALYVHRQLVERDRLIADLRSEVATATRNNTAQWDKINELVGTVNQLVGNRNREELAVEALPVAPHDDPVRAGLGKVLAAAAVLITALASGVAAWFMGGPGPSP